MVKHCSHSLPEEIKTDTIRDRNITRLHNYTHSESRTDSHF